MTAQHHLCPDCKVIPSQNHRFGCSVETCAGCGLTANTCGCLWGKIGVLKPVPWTGLPVGYAECQQHNFYTRNVPGQGWIPCQQDDLGAWPDLNRLHQNFLWNRETQRFDIPIAKSRK